MLNPQFSPKRSAGARRGLPPGEAGDIVTKVWARVGRLGTGSDEPNFGSEFRPLPEPPCPSTS
jgi:hypothetical protein